MYENIMKLKDYHLQQYIQNIIKFQEFFLYILDIVIDHNKILKIYFIAL